MNFGNTLEEQYVKISAINKLLKKYGKFFSTLFLVFAVFLFLISLTDSENRATFMLVSVIVGIFGFFAGKYYLGKIYGWAWIAFCEKYNPKGLAKSLSKAAHDSAIEGYIFGGTSGAKAAFSGVVIVFAFLLTFYIWKGTYYMIKYRNLPKREAELKRQLEQQNSNIVL